ncbi:MAG: hypothetical protein JW850_21955 [Thermoflexales bacterium]|nr:hypothetical protein [Thermoflexales bacterium]
MSSLIDKILTLINARVRGPQHSSKPKADAGEQAAVPSAPAKVPEVTEGRPRRSTAEVSEATAEPDGQAREAPTPPPAGRQTPPSSGPGGELDGGRVADMLKKKRE